MIQELDPRPGVRQVHEQVPCLLHDPRLDGMLCGAQDPDAAGTVLDHGKACHLLPQPARSPPLPPSPPAVTQTGTAITAAPASSERSIPSKNPLTPTSPVTRRADPLAISRPQRIGVVS
jgi:hypothetical protein